MNLVILGTWVYRPIQYVISETIYRLETGISWTGREYSMKEEHFIAILGLALVLSHISLSIGNSKASPFPKLSVLYLDLLDSSRLFLSYWLILFVSAGRLDPQSMISTVLILPISIALPKRQDMRVAYQVVPPEESKVRRNMLYLLIEQKDMGRDGSGIGTDLGGDDPIESIEF
ncbi:hypothetical protein ACJX0J_004944, partial (mitochondrion) [Zea mays]